MLPNMFCLIFQNLRKKVWQKCFKKARNYLKSKVFLYDEIINLYYLIILIDVPRFRMLRLHILQSMPQLHRTFCSYVLLQLLALRPWSTFPSQGSRMLQMWVQSRMRIFMLLYCRILLYSKLSTRIFDLELYWREAWTYLRSVYQQTSNSAKRI